MMLKSFEIKPLHLGVWFLGFALLLVLPLTMTYRQGMNRLESEYKDQKRSLHKKLQQTLSHLHDEMSTPFQIERLARKFMFRRRPLFLSESYRKIAVKRLRTIIPCAKLLWFDRNYQIDWTRSDAVPVKTPFNALLEGIFLRKNEVATSPALAEQEKNLYTKLKWFGDSDLMNSIFRQQQEAFSIAMGKDRKTWLLWSSLEDEVSEGGSGRLLGGFILFISDREVPLDLSARMFQRNNARKLRKLGIEIGWVDERNPRLSHYPSRLPLYKRPTLMRALLKRATTTYEEEPLALLGSILHHESGLVLFALGSTRRFLDNLSIARWRLERILFFLAFIPIFTVVVFRANKGLALGIRPQIIGLFLFAVGTPTLATIQIGLDLVRDHRIAAEREAYQMMEGLSEALVNSVPLAYRQLEVNATKMIKLVQNQVENRVVDLLHIGEEGRKFLSGKISEVFATSGVTHFFIMDDSGNALFQRSSSAMRESEGKEFQPLFSALARMKLKASGKERSGKGEILDQLLEHTLGDIQSIKGILEQGDRPFNLQALGKSLYAYIKLLPAADPERTIVYIFVANDNLFERNFLDFFLDQVLTKEEAAAEGVEIYALSNDAKLDDILIPTSGKHNRYNGTDSAVLRRRLINTAIPTLRNGFTVTSEVEATGKKWLFLSQRTKYLNRFSLLYLYNKSRIDERIIDLQKQTAAYVILYFFITIILGFVLSRGLLEPIAYLRSGVEAIQAEEYRTSIRIPGKDELVELGDAFNSMAHGLWERQQMTTMLSRSAVASVKEESGVRLGGELGFGCVLFVGIQGFATFVESHTPEQVVQFLNEYFSLVHDVVGKHRGDIDKFMSDTIMAVFPMPEEATARPASACLSVRCAIALLEATNAFNVRRRTISAKNAVPIAVDIGIAAGEWIAGNIGSTNRKDHTVVGEIVTVASALVKESPHGTHTRIIVNSGLAELLHDHVIFEKRKTDLVRGMTKSVEMFEVVRWIEPKT
ncbi:MAG: adenylate/guanylate cyclase domain-containing protein [Candidatus Ozemobacteraceae bacterium]